MTEDTETHYISDMTDLPDGSVDTGTVATSYPPQLIFKAPNGNLYYVMQQMPEPWVHRSQPPDNSGMDGDGI